MKPVAWIAYDEFGDFMLEPTPDGDYSWQPLYTAPRELSDEEIMKEWHSIYSDTSEDVLIDFARAILKKASEK